MIENEIEIEPLQAAKHQQIPAPTLDAGLDQESPPRLDALLVGLLVLIALAGVLGFVAGIEQLLRANDLLAALVGIGMLLCGVGFPLVVTRRQWSAPHT